MKSILLSAASRLVKRTLVRGSIERHGNGTTWTVPKGVYSICIGMIAGGERSTSSLSGKGGNFRYINDYPVEPGQTFTLVGGGIGQPSSCGPFNTNTPLGGAVKGRDGSSGRSGTSPGGNAGAVSDGAQGSGFNLNNGWITTGGNTHSGVYGGGGGVAYSGQYRNGYEPAMGQVRIMWGEGRSFPSTGLLD